MTEKKEYGIIKNQYFGRNDPNNGEAITLTGNYDAFTAICRQFTDLPVTEIEAVTEGHINDTFLMKTPAGRYVLQRLQPKMDPAKLLYNYGLSSAACEAAGWAYPKWMPCRYGEYFHTDAEGQRWRMYPYIEAETLQAPLTKERLFACGEGLARLHGILRNLPASPKPVYPILHDLGAYYERYCATLSGDNLCEESRVPEIEERIREGIDRFLTTNVMENADSADIRVIHGDAKLSNILFRDGEVIGMLDWDTVMTGSVSEELADCIRSCCVNRGAFDREAADVLSAGYRSGMPEAEAAVSHLPRAFDKINFELALRYYTDAISKEKIFKERYPGYRLERVRELLGVTWR
ncbi:MAG: phosphotransferase [Lachnospiraceae bacterium]|nr:phosphotransferase [Lachnospiraceae bacterium]